MAIICARLNSSVDIACRDIQARQESWQVEFEAKEAAEQEGVPECAEQSNNLRLLHVFNTT